MGKLFITSSLVLLIDQFTKWYVVIYLNLIEIGSIDVFPPVLNFRMAWNEGINFGLFSGKADMTRWILIAVALGICIGMLIWSRKFSGWVAMALFGLVIGGALGNIFDRLIYGAVADFLNMSCCGLRNPFSFNVADIAVFAGLIALAIFSERLTQRA
jgi:signal peptidase II